jgi:peptide/nickel transport system permease protein
MAVAEPVVLPPVPAPSRTGRVSRDRTRLQAWAGVGLLGLVTLVALGAKVIAPHDPLMPVGLPLQPPGTGGFVLGSDSIGRDILSRLLAGLQLSWFGAVVVIASGLLVGGLVGLVAGAVGGWVDTVLMRVTDLFLALPAPVLAIAVVAALGPGLRNTLLAVGVVWWPFYARIVRGEIRTLRARPHVEAARLAGTGGVRIALRHLLPGAVPAAVVAASLDVGALVLTLAGLSFLGLGQPAPAAELGADSARNLSYLLQQWWIPAMPGIAVMLLALVGNVAGDGVRVLLDKR